MAIRPGAPQRQPDFGPGQFAEARGHGGLFATVVSGIALLFSGLSYYESSLKTANLAVYVPPMIHYARDGDSDVFNVPITIANDGAQSGTVLNMELHVENLRAQSDRKSARFHSAFLGEYPRDDNTLNRSFAPLSIPGHGTFTDTVRFYPMDEPLPFVVDEKGDYRFTLALQTAKPDNPGIIEKALRTDPEPLTFELNLPFISFQHLTFRKGTIAMYNKSWKPAVSSSTAPAVGSKLRDAPAAEPETEVPEAPGAVEAPLSPPVVPEAKPVPQAAPAPQAVPTAPKVAPPAVSSAPHQKSKP